ncbi:hypothetical protein QVD17_11924 [Tagetes erecta]|uniref:Uncharacterized protein n=1 Tax=Tagetes erecta TaxID=13708 RepID=A0AAD8P2H4_TARER|nr:hypothetical protein QVD17_11924 [Tagetes erecta]
MGDSNVDSSGLARKLLKIDGNPRVNLLRGSSKGNDASKTNPSSRNPVRGATVISNMTINPNLNDHTANGNTHAANGNAHASNVLDDTANDSAHTAGHYANTARVDNHTATANAYTAKGDTINDTAMSHNAKDVLKVGDTAKVDMQNVHTASVNKQKTDTGRVMVDNFESSKIEKASDDTTNVIHESNAEAELLASFKMASLDEERFLKQKSNVHWLAQGDANTKYFHNTLKCRNHRARIDVTTDSNGILHEGKAVPKAFVDHYVGFLGKEEAFIIPLTQELFDVRIDQAISDDMIREVTVDEIRRTFFAFADDKAPGPDGFTAAFYKKAWDIVDSGG